MYWIEYDFINMYLLLYFGAFSIIRHQCFLSINDHTHWVTSKIILLSINVKFYDPM